MYFQLSLTNGKAQVVTSPDIHSLLCEFENPRSFGYLDVGDGTYINVDHIVAVRELRSSSAEDISF